MATTRRTSTKTTARKPAVKKTEPVETVKEKASIPSDWEKQAKEIIKMAKSSGLQENFFFKTTFERYLTQVRILADLQKTIETSEMLVKKEYVKGRGNLYANPAIKEYNSTTDSANKTVQTLIKILKGFKSSDNGNEQDALLAIINGGEDEEEG